MSTREKHINRRALVWAIAMTVALYAMVWVAAGPPVASAKPLPVPSATAQVGLIGN